MDLNDIAIFERIVREGSFSAAARSLGTAKSTLSTRIKRLEERLGAKLMDRTTRNFILTDAGAAYFEHCRQIVAEAMEAERAVRTLETEPAGLLRVTAPPVFAQRIVGPHVLDLLDRYPALRIDLVATDREVAPAREGVDVALLMDPRDDPTLRSRDLGTIALYPVASLRFIARHGRPEMPKDLSRFRCIGTGVDEAWTFDSATVTVRPVLTANRWEIARSAVLEGIGIA
ncbi:MAG: LysR substrate-binding domain-containing protein, partial [Myxococcota bacterium]